MIVVEKNLLVDPKPNCAYEWRIANFIRYLYSDDTKSEKYFRDFLYWINANALTCTIKTETERIETYVEGWSDVLKKYAYNTVTIGIITRRDRIASIDLKNLMDIVNDNYKCIITPNMYVQNRFGIDIQLYGLSNDKLMQILKELPLV